LYLFCCSSSIAIYLVIDNPFCVRLCLLHHHHPQAIKAAQRENRQRKKELRQAFKREEISMNNQLAQQRVHNPQGVRI
jgi:hypothetical protein